MELADTPSVAAARGAESMPPAAEQWGQEHVEYSAFRPTALQHGVDEILAKDTKLVPDFWREKYDAEAAKYWDLFYKRNQDNFFKDRRYLADEFVELVEPPDGRPTQLLEVGCGVGNTVFPLIEANSTLTVHCCDFSDRAITIVKEHPLYSSGRVNAFVCDVTVSGALLSNVPAATVDAASLFFVLSAISPAKMPCVLQEILGTLRPGGRLLFRDYGLHDHAQLRFKPNKHKLGDNFYVRQDGTRAYYFDKGLIEQMVEDAGFITRSCKYQIKQVTNRKEGSSMDRIFVQGVFERPSTAAAGERSSGAMVCAAARSLASPSALSRHAAPNPVTAADSATPSAASAVAVTEQRAEPAANGVCRSVADVARESRADVHQIPEAAVGSYGRGNDEVLVCTTTLSYRHSEYHVEEVRTTGSTTTLTATKGHGPDNVELVAVVILNAVPGPPPSFTLVSAALTAGMSLLRRPSDACSPDNRG